MIHLYSEISNKIKYKDKVIKINISFDVVLKLLNILQSKLFSENEKENYCFELLLSKDCKGFSYDEKAEIIEFIFKNIIEFERNRKPLPEKQEKPPLIDFNQDVAEIYSSFKEQYNMDLFAQQGKLHWIKFVFLLNGLNKNTALGEVIAIRTAKLPDKITEHNKKQVAELKRLKKLYFIDSIKNKKKETFEDQLLKMGIAMLGAKGIKLEK